MVLLDFRFVILFAEIIFTLTIDWSKIEIYVGCFAGTAALRFRQEM